MADTKISALPSLTTLADADIVPVSQGGTTKGAAASTFKTYIGSGGTRSQVSGSNFTTTSSTLVNITGLTFAASANKLYKIEGLIKFSGDNASGLRFGVQYSASLASHCVDYLGASNSQAGAHYCNTVFNDPSVTFGTTTTTAMVVIIKGFLTTGANAGNFTIQVHKVTSGTATIYIGSEMVVNELA